jgi:hypothetical protein
MKSGPLYRWKRPQYERLIGYGLLDEDDPVEFLDGLLLVKEPRASPYRTAILLVTKALERALGRSPRPTRSSASPTCCRNAGCLRLPPASVPVTKPVDPRFDQPIPEIAISRH